MKKYRTKKLTVALCVAVMLVGAGLAVFFARDKIPVLPTTETTSESASEAETAEKPSETSTSATDKTESTQKESESDGQDESEAKKLFTLTDSPELKGSYSPTEFEKALFDAVNGVRTENGKKALEYSSVLHSLAKIRSDEAVEKWSHTRPDGRSPSSVFDDNSLSFTAFGECLARGADETDEGARVLTEGLLKSDKQAEILLGEEYSFLAVAVSENPDKTVSAALLLCNP